MNLKIYIPSLKRSDKVITLSQFSVELLAKVTLVVDPDEVLTYMRGTDGRVNILPCNEIGIASTRQWIVDHACSNGYEKIAMLDDDLTFGKRRSDDPTKFRTASSTDVDELMLSVEQSLNDEVPHVGVCAREGGNRMMYDTSNTRMLRILAYHTPTISELGLRFDRISLMEDFDMTLQLLRAGKPNLVLHDWVHGQVRSNAPGGCSTYRQLQKQATAANRLEALHPKFVRTVQKTTKIAWGGATRTDVTVQWKRAYAMAEPHRPLPTTTS